MINGKRRRRKKAAVIRIPLFYLRLTVLLLLFLSVAITVLVYQNAINVISEDKKEKERLLLERSLEYLFPPEPPKPERGKGYNLSAQLQKAYKWDTKYANLVSFAIIYQAARRKLDVAIVKSVIHHESSGNPFAISDKDCHGLMQVNAVNYNYIDKYHPWVNVREGSKILSHYINRFGVYEGLLAYNGSIPNNPHFESVTFANRVLNSL